MKARIEELYGSVDKMLAKTNSNISRSYIYQMINDQKTNISLKVALELKEMLFLNSVEDIIPLITNN